MKKRLLRLNSLLKEVLAEVIMNEVRNPKVAKIVSPTRVEISNNMHYAVVYISVLGSDIEKKETIKALNSASGYISTIASKKMSIRYFPKLEFRLDNSTDTHLNIERILDKIHNDSPSHE